MNNQEMASFEAFKNSEYLSYKHKNYFPIYDEVLSKYRGKENITFVEVGIFNGGSLFMWREFFGPGVRIIGIDFNPEAIKWREHGFDIFIGDQSDPNFWKRFFSEVGRIDILLDDGGHTNKQQIITCAESFQYINDGGLILVEDVHTNYQPEFGSPSQFSFVEYSKKLVDKINYRFPIISLFGKKNIPDYLVHSVTFYESIVVLKINRKLSIDNVAIDNGKGESTAVDYRNHGTFQSAVNLLSSRIGLVNTVPSSLKRWIKFLINAPKNLGLRKFFK
jgi:hypothetical protein